VLKNVFALLHCVPVAGNADATVPAAAAGPTYLFAAAEVECYQPWQTGLFVVMGLLIALPIALLLWTWRAHSRLTAAAADSGGGGGGRSSSRVGASSAPLLMQSVQSLEPSSVAPARAGAGCMGAALEVLCSPYRAEASYWSSVLLLQRLALIAVNTFLVVPNTRQISLLVVLTGFVLVHVYRQPFRRAASNFYATLCATLLVVIGVLNLPVAALATGAYQPNDTMQKAFRNALIAEAVLLPVPLLVGAVLFARYRWRRWKRSRAEAAGKAVDK
jgi:hypothetical protein